MKKALLYILSILSISGCITISTEEYPSDRVAEMGHYARFRVDREVKETIRYLAMAYRLDEYINLSDSEKLASKWKDISGNVFVNGNGDIQLLDFATFKTGRMRLGEETAEWAVIRPFSGMSFVCAAPDTWMCTVDGTPSNENAIKVSLKDKEKGIWAIEYSSSEKEGEHSAVFSSTGLEARYVAKYPSYEQALILDGEVIVEFSQEGPSEVGWVKLKWSWSEDPETVTSSFGSLVQEGV